MSTVARPPYDAELEAALAASGWSAPTSKPSIEDLISLVRAEPVVPDLDQLTAGRDVEYLERLVPGPPGDPDVALLILRPRDLSAPAPGIYSIHGGGMIAGDRFGGVPAYLDMVERYGTVVVSVEYRLAPEHPDPAPVEDSYAGLVWTAAHAGELGIDPNRLILEGGSAGGGIAAGVALLARDRGGPRLAGQMLICPMLDDRDATVSTHQFEDLGMWDRDQNRLGWTALLGDRRAGPDVSIYAAPARAIDLAGLPPAFLDVGSAEVFRDEVVAYASAIWASGGDAELHVWPGGCHGFSGAAPQSAIALGAIDAQNRWLTRILGV